MLVVEKLAVRYGAVEAVRGIDLTVKQGEIVALLGARRWQVFNTGSDCGSCQAGIGQHHLRWQANCRLATGNAIPVRHRTGTGRPPDFCKSHSG